MSLILNYNVHMALIVTFVILGLTDMVDTRTAKIEDISDITRLMNEFHSKPTTENELKKQLETIIASDRSDIILVSDDTIVNAMAIVDTLLKLPKVECRINEVVVSEQVRGKGYGKILMKACEQWAWNHGASFIELSSRPSREAANGLYQTIGYKKKDTNVYVLERP